MKNEIGLGEEFIILGRPMTNSYYFLSRPFVLGSEVSDGGWRR